MATQIPPEKAFCPQAGKRHSEIFNAANSSEAFCGYCGFANPFHARPGRRPAYPGPNNEVIEIEDDLPTRRRGSPASQLMRDRPRPPASGLQATQLLPRVQLPSRPRDDIARFISAAQVAHEAIDSQKNRSISSRKSSTQRSGQVFVILHVIIVQKERVLLGTQWILRTVDTTEILEMSLRFHTGDLASWPAFLAVISDKLKNTDELSGIEIQDSEIWSLSWASSYTRGKPTTVPIDDFAAPGAFILSPHFTTNQQGHRRLFLVLTTTATEEEDISSSSTNSTSKTHSVRRERKPSFPSRKVKSELGIKKEKKRLRQPSTHPEIIVRSLSTNGFDSDIASSPSRTTSLLDSTNNSDILNPSHRFNSEEPILTLDMTDVNSDNEAEYFARLEEAASSLAVDSTISVDTRAGEGYLDQLV